MSVDGVSLFAPIGYCVGGSVDYEQIQIERLLKMYGIEPSGNKAADKARLHDIELQKAKAQNEPSGKFLTISYGKEQEIIKSKKERLYGSIKNYKKEKGNDEDVLKPDEILGRQIFAIIELKKREEKQDYEKSKSLHANSVKSKNKKSQTAEKEFTVQQPSAIPEITLEQKELKVNNPVDN